MQVTKPVTSTPIAESTLSAMEQLVEWLVTSGKLRELATVLRAHEADQKARPWAKGPMAIQRFSIPDSVADAFEREGGRPLTRQVSWQGGQLCVECACHVLITERQMEALIQQYCPQI